MPRTQTTRCRVLVVEDDPSSRRALVLLLKLRGFDATFASNVKDALEQLSSTPDCILLDLMLPDGNGATILEHVRNNRLATRVAVTTGAGNWQALLGANSSRPDTVFTKPLNIEQVIGWLLHQP